MLLGHEYQVMKCLQESDMGIEKLGIGTCLYLVYVCVDMYRYMNNELDLCSLSS